MSWRLNHSTDIDLCDSFYARIAPQSLAKAGGRGNPDDWKYTNIPEPVMLERGYTGHSLYRSIGKHLDEFGLINMNGRMYDPVLRRFLGADPVVQKPAFSQSYNGYSYCFNNPLKYLDPTGFIATDGDTEESESIESAAMAYNALWGGSKMVQFWRERFGDMSGTVFGEEKYNAAVQRQKEKQERSSGGCDNPDVLEVKIIENGKEIIILVPATIAVPAGDGGEPLPSWIGWTNNGINTAAFGAYEAGGTFRLMKSGSLSLGWYKSGWSTGNQYVKTTYSLTKLGKFAGYGTSFLGAGFGIYNFSVSDKSWGDYGQLGVSLLSAGLTCFPATTPVGIGIGFVDLGGGFNGFYNYLDSQQQLYNSTGGIMLPVNGIPYFIRLRK